VTRVQCNNRVPGPYPLRDPDPPKPFKPIVAGRRIIGRADSATLMLAELADGGLALVVVPDGTTDIAKASPRI